MIKEDNKRNESIMLVNKENQDVFLVVPNVVESEWHYIISGCNFPQEYHLGDVYLPKEKWLKKPYKFKLGCAEPRGYNLQTIDEMGFPPPFNEGI